MKNSRNEGIRDGEMRGLEEVWGRFVNSKFAKWLGLVMGIGLAVTTAACEVANAKPSTQPVETAPLPSDNGNASPAPVVEKTKTPVPTKVPTMESSPTVMVAYDVYNPDSFPADMKAIAQDPMRATPEQQQQYQSFLDKQRQLFFEKQGIKAMFECLLNGNKQVHL